MRYEDWYSKHRRSLVVNNLALRFPQAEPRSLELAVVAVNGAPVQSVAAPSAFAREVAWIGIIMCILQVLDGTLTAIGVLHHGIASEGNFLIRALMEAWGPVFALIVVKSLAIAVVGVLCILAFRLPWITKALRIIAVIYVGAAIIPWSAIIVTRIL